MKWQIFLNKFEKKFLPQLGAFFFLWVKKIRLPEFGCGESGEDAGVGEFDVGVGEP